jgi:hypothetical protein
MPRGFDKEDLGKGLLLSLPMREATGTVLTQDVAKPHHLVTMIHSPVWTALANGLQVLDFDGNADYMECDGASCADLNFTTGDFSIACWCYWEGMTGGVADILMGRYELSVSGWELYFDDSDPLRTLNLRVHHAGDPAGDRTAGYSLGWTKDTWWLVGVSRSGAYPLMYRNGAAVEMTYSAGGIANPSTCAEDLVIGVRYTKNVNFYDGKLWNPRIWGRSLSATEWAELFNQERHLLGV